MADLDRATCGPVAAGNTLRAADTSDAGTAKGTGDTAGIQVGARKPPTTIISLLGDGRRFGRWRVARRTLILNVLGSWTLDLRGALLDESTLADAALDLRFVSLVGDLVVSVPDGVVVEVSGLVVLGDRRLDLAVVPEVPGTPRLRLRLAGLIGDVRVTSGSLVGRPGRFGRRVGGR